MIIGTSSQEIRFLDQCSSDRPAGEGSVCSLRPSTHEEYDVDRFQELDLLDSRGKIRLRPAQRYFNENENYFPLLPRLFDVWKGQDEYVLMKHTDPDGEKLYVALKCAKRGNDVYNHRLKERFKWIKDKVKDLKFFNVNDFRPDRKVKTRLLWVTLSYNVKREPNIRRAWQGIGEDWNRFISALRSRYGHVGCLRSWEESKQGYPHIHAVLSFESAEFTVFPHYNAKEGRMTFRIQEKAEFEPYWHSFIDVQAISSMKCLVNYVMKYQIKIHEGHEEGKYSSKTLAFMWLFRKRSYSVSGQFREMFSDLIRDLHNSNMVAGQDRGSWECLGVFGAGDLHASGEWVVEVDERTALKLIGDERERFVDLGVINVD